jgi:hypothetical protein
VSTRLTPVEVPLAAALPPPSLTSREAELDPGGAASSVVGAVLLCVSAATNVGVCDSIMAVCTAELSNSWEVACSLPARGESDESSA